MEKKRVYKYQLNGEIVGMPEKAKIVFFGMQDLILTIWAEVNENDLNVNRSAAIIGTGQYVPTGLSHMGTAFDGPYVWHLYM